MPTPIDQLLEDFAMPVLEDQAGVTIILRRRGQADVTIEKAIFEHVQFEIVSEENFSTAIEGREWVIPVAAYAEPRPGDYLVIDGEGVWEVLPSGGTKHAEKMPGGFRWLVRTKRVG